MTVAKRHARDTHRVHAAPTGAADFVMVVLGPQGSGKGTQANVLAERFGLRHLDMGTLLRRVAKQSTALGRSLDRIMNVQGRLVPTATVVRVLRQELRRVPTRQGFLFDGFPRNVAQARELDRLLRALKRPLTHVFYLPISQATTVKRLGLRRTCERCNRIFIAGKTIGVKARRCPVCGGRAVQRADDTPAAIIKRLAEYRRHTQPVVTYYRRRGILHTVNGEPAILVVTRAIFSLVRA